MTQTLASYFQLIRAANIFTVISNISAAYIIAFNGELSWQIMPLFLISACLYHGGMALNDCIDIDGDKIDNPNRPLPAGRIPLANAWLLVLLLFLIAIVIASFLPPKAFAVAVLLAGVIIIYDAFIKKGIPGSLVMGTCRYLNWLLPLSLTPFTFHSFTVAIPVFLYVTGLTILSKEEHSGNDRTALALCSALILVALLIICSTSFYTQTLIWLVIPILVLFMGWIASKIYRCFKSFSAETIQALMKTLILGIIPLDALILASRGHLIASVVVIALLPISLQAAKRIYVT